MSLSQKEIKRYSRHILLSEIGLEGQKKLKQAKVLVIGAGGLGCPVLQYLTAAGIGKIGIVDFDVVDETNLQRQILFSEEDIKKPKVEVAKKKLSKQNSNLQFTIYNLRLKNENGMEIFKDYDVIVDCSDNFATRYLVNDACVTLDKPFVYGSILKFEGQVSVFNFGKNSPSYRCLFPNPPSENESPNCSEVGVMGVLSGIIGCLQANEVIKMICGIGEVLSGKLFLFDVLNLQTKIISFSRNENEIQKIKNLNGELERFDYEKFCTSPPFPLSQKRGDETKSGGEVKEISNEELQQKISMKENIQLIDVREPWEHEEKNIGGELIPLNEIFKQAEKISKDQPVIIYCKSGVRSTIAIQRLQEKFGFKNLYNLKGGI